MTQDAPEIEVEVVEIDGVTQVAGHPRAMDVPDSRREWQDWRHWQGRVRRFDNRWWPLWVVLGVIALALALTVGVFIGLIWLVIRTVAHLVRAILP